MVGPEELIDCEGITWNWGLLEAAWACFWSTKAALPPAEAGTTRLSVRQRSAGSYDR
jgi:hypothetical protein